MLSKVLVPNRAEDAFKALLYEPMRRVIVVWIQLLIASNYRQFVPCFFTELRVRASSVVQNMAAECAMREVSLLA